jgi:sialidase-1
MVTTSAGSASVIATGAHADNQWHHVVLRRQAGTVTLFVDGTAVASGTGGAGAVHGDDPTPIYIGQRLDGANRLHGSMDEFRVYGRALTDAELGLLRTGNTASIPGLTAHLPMNAVVPSGA